MNFHRKMKKKKDNCKSKKGIIIRHDFNVFFYTYLVVHLYICKVKYNQFKKSFWLYKILYFVISYIILHKTFQNFIIVNATKY